MSTQEETAMAYHLCQSRASKLNIKAGCGCERDRQPPCSAVAHIAIEAIRLGAKLPDPRMDRGRAAYESFYMLPQGQTQSSAWESEEPFVKESWARAAEAARAAP